VGGINVEELICQGCGAPIQTENASLPGYIPASALGKNDEVICKRCFRLKHYNEVQDVAVTDDDFFTLISEISNKDGLVVKLVDIFDFNGSFIGSIKRLVGDKPIILVGNKVDLLPKSTNHERVKQWLRGAAKEYGIQVADVHLISAKRGIGMGELEDSIQELRKGEDVFVVGSTNVGKSTFINALIKHSTGINDAITTSYFPGTTLGFIDIPLDDSSSLYDTPGIVNRQQIAHYVTDKELKTVTPNKEIKSRIFQLNEKQTLFIGGLARIDFESGERQPFVCYFSNALDIHRTKLENANDLYERQKGELLAPPHKDQLENFPAFQKASFRIKEQKTDIVIPGLGWITLTGEPASITVHTPKGVPATVRRSLI
jgi:30S ribosome assembly GTPase